MFTDGPLVGLNTSAPGRPLTHTFQAQEKVPRMSAGGQRSQPGVDLASTSVHGPRSTKSGIARGVQTSLVPSQAVPGPTNGRAQSSTESKRPRHSLNLRGLLPPSFSASVVEPHTVSRLQHTPCRDSDVSTPAAIPLAEEYITGVEWEAGGLVVWLQGTPEFRDR